MEERMKNVLENAPKPLQKHEASAAVTPRSKKAKASPARWIPLLVGLMLMVGLGALFTTGAKGIFIGGKAAVDQQGDPWAPQRFIVPKARSIRLDAFVIPFMKSTNFTYVSLNISFSLRNGEIRAEMIEKKTRLRGIIFDRLNNEINLSEQIPSLEELKAIVMEEINRSLTSGKIHDAYVTDFLIM